MSFNPSAELDRAAQHYANLACAPGWWQQAQHGVSALEAAQGTHGMYCGLRARVGAVVRASGYRPTQHELKELK